MSFALLVHCMTPPQPSVRLSSSLVVVEDDEDDDDLGEVCKQQKVVSFS